MSRMGEDRVVHRVLAGKPEGKSLDLRGSRGDRGMEKAP